MVNMDTINDNKGSIEAKKTLKKDYLLYIGVFLLSLLFNMLQYFNGEVHWYLRTDDLGPLMYPMAIVGEKFQYFMQSFEHYYGYGYYWIFAPLFFLKQPREMILIEISIVNVVFISGISVIISLYMHKILKIENTLVNVCLPLIMTVYYGMNNNILMGGHYRTDNEVPIFFYVWFITFAILLSYSFESTRKKSVRNGILLALILVWGMSIHERLLAVMVPTIFIVFLLRLLGNKSINLLSFGLTFGIGFFGQNVLKNFLKASFAMGSAVKNTSVVTNKRIWEFESLDNIYKFLLVLWGNFSSMVLNSFGIASIGIILLVIVVFITLFLKNKRKKVIEMVKKHPGEFAGLFVFVMATAITILGIGHEWGGAYVFKDNTKGLHYTRYFYSYCGPLIFFTVCILHRDKSKIIGIVKKSSALIMLIVALSDILLMYPLEAKMSERYLSHMYSFNFFNSYFDNLLISCVISLTIAVIIIVEKETKRVTSMDLACVILVICLFANRIHFIEWRFSAVIYDRDVEYISDSIEIIKDKTKNMECYLDMDETTGNRRKRNSIVYLTEGVCFLSEKANPIRLEDDILVVSEREREDLLNGGCQKVEICDSDLVMYTNSSQIYNILTDGGESY